MNNKFFELGVPLSRGEAKKITGGGGSHALCKFQIDCPLDEACVQNRCITEDEYPGDPGVPASWGIPCIVSADCPWGWQCNGEHERCVSGW